MHKISPQTKSFIFLLSVALVGTYLCLLLANNLKQHQVATPSDLNEIIYPPKTTASATAPDPIVDTSDWKTYTNKSLGLNFKYKPGWQVKPAVKKGDFYVTEVDPGTKYYNIKIYTSKTGFYAMDSLPTKEVTVGGKTAQDVSDMLYGVQNTPYYYTFDLGLSVSLKPEFNGLVKSVSFTE
jgi:hypothetical protein